MKKGKLVCSIIIFILLITVVLLKFNSNNNIILDEVFLREYIDNSSGMFAIMVENDSGEYVEYDSNSFPTNMAYNSSLSGCIDSNGNTLDAVLSFNSVISSATVSTSETAYCYLYFDIGTTLANAILLAENGDETVDDAISYIASKGEPDFTTTSTTDEGLYAAEDDYGTSYYFRGAVEDNYVYFAGFYWRIVRINGDGSVRLIYDGTEAHGNGESSSDRYIKSSYFYNANVYSSPGGKVNRTRNALVGYMYGDFSYSETISESTTTLTWGSSYFYSSTYSFNSETGLFYLSESSTAADSSDYDSIIGKYVVMSGSYNGSSYFDTIYYVTSASSSTIIAYKYTSTIEKTPQTYADEHANVNDSYIKTTVDSWYKSYLSSYSSYLNDTLFCNDRSLYSGTGIGTTATVYSAYNRLLTENSPTLKCENKNDRFTVNDIVNGNGDLSYPIALITADEVVMAGSLYLGNVASLEDSSSYASYYLYGSSIMTMTPSSYVTGTFAMANIMYVYGDGFISTYMTNYPGSAGVRPVINLSSSVIVTSGDGTYDSPYTVALS